MNKKTIDNLMAEFEASMADMQTDEQIHDALGRVAKALLVYEAVARATRLKKPRPAEDYHEAARDHKRSRDETAATQNV